MGKHGEATINYCVYEDSVEYLGITEITLPDIEYLASELSGAGISGTLEDTIIGHVNAMTATFNFRTVTNEVVRLAEPRVHKIDLRVAQQNFDTRAAQTGVAPIKHVMKIKPKKTGLGKLAVASAADASGEYAVLYYAMYMDGSLVTEIDPLNFICLINGTDYLAEVRTALGK